jgi:endonuclease YncB( thermonuclease family)
MIKYLLAFCVLATPLYSEQFLARVVNVSDGDTVKVLDEGDVGYKIRLYGIDAPEKKQPFGEKSRQALWKNIGKTSPWVKVIVVNTDRYGRKVAILWNVQEILGGFDPTVGGQSINISMVQQGWAWAYRDYLKKSDKQDFINAEKEARESKLGFWADKNPTPPWQFRKSKKRKQ